MGKFGMTKKLLSDIIGEVGSEIMEVVIPLGIQIFTEKALGKDEK